MQCNASVNHSDCIDNAGLESQDLGGVYIEGFVQASTAIELGSLKRVLPEHQMTDAGKIIRVICEEVLHISSSDQNVFLLKPLSG